MFIVLSEHEKMAHQSSKAQVKILVGIQLDNVQIEICQLLSMNLENVSILIFQNYLVLVNSWFALRILNSWNNGQMRDGA